MLLCFTHTSVYPPNLGLCIVYLSFAIVFWWIYLTKKSVWHFSHISFSSILKQKNLSKYAKVIIKIYYLSIFVALILASLVISLARSVGAAVFALVIVGSLISIILVIKFDIYQHRFNNRRAIANSIAVIILTVLAAASEYAYDKLGTGAIIAYLEFTLLLLVLLWNIAVWVITTYKSTHKED